MVSMWGKSNRKYHVGYVNVPQHNLLRPDKNPASGSWKSNSVEPIADDLHDVSDPLQGTPLLTKP